MLSAIDPLLRMMDTPYLFYHWQLALKQTGLQSLPVNGLPK